MKFDIISIIYGCGFHGLLLLLLLLLLCHLLLFRRCIHLVNLKQKVQKKRKVCLIGGCGQLKITTHIVSTSKHVFKFILCTSTHTLTQTQNFFSSIYLWSIYIFIYLYLFFNFYFGLPHANQPRDKIEES